MRICTTIRALLDQGEMQRTHRSTACGLARVLRKQTSKLLASAYSTPPGRGPTRLLAFWSLFAVLTVVSASGPVTAPADAPRADKKPVRLEKHEHVRIDDYFWLHKRDNPKVIDHLKGENDYLERALA